MTVFIVGIDAGCVFPAAVFSESPTASFGSKEIAESSGIVLSRKYPGIFWTHNDSGDLPRIFAIRRNGQLVSQVKVRGAEHIDWEDIAADDQGRLYICDIGNNLELRSEMTVYVIDEPNPFEDTSAEVRRRIHYRYSTDPGRFNFDAEACFWNGGYLYVLTKHPVERNTQLFRLNLSDVKDRQVAVKVGEYPIKGQVTAADVSPDGRRLAVLTYRKIHFFDKPNEHDNYLAGSHTEIPIKFRQAEGICFDGRALVLTNEQGQILRIPMDRK